MKKCLSFLFWKVIHTQINPAETQGDFMADMTVRETVSALLDREVRPTRMTVREIGAALWDITRHYPISAYGILTNGRLFEDIETYCMFIGYRRSGKTLTASLLDAHPNVIIANELGVLRYIYAGFNRRQIYYLLLRNSLSFTKAGRRSKGYSHRIATQFQGSFKKLLVIGDDPGGGGTLRLCARPWLIDRLYRTIGVRMRFFHVVRNPYDNISSISKRMDKSLAESIEYYFSLCGTVADVKKRLKKDELFEFRHELFLAEPEDILKKICTFLRVDAPDDYLKDCADIVIRSPHKSRYDILWDSSSIDIVKERMSQFLFLEGYSYED